MARTTKQRTAVQRILRGGQGLPEYDRTAVPEGMVTRRQMRDLGLAPGGQEPVAILRCRLCATRPQWSCRHPTRGLLLRVDLAVPKRVPTLAQERALDRAMAARQTCPECLTRYYACLPLRTHGRCVACQMGVAPSPDTVMIPAPAAHQLAA